MSSSFRITVGQLSDTRFPLLLAALLHPARLFVDAGDFGAQAQYSGLCLCLSSG